MTVYMLQQGNAVTLPAQLVVVRLQTTGGQPPPQLDALVKDLDGTERSLGDVTRYAGSLVLTVSELTTIRLRPPPEDEVFAPNSTFSVVIGAESQEADRVVLSAVDASGLRRRDLVTLSPVGDEIVVTALAETRESALVPLAARARVAAREVLSTSAVPADRSVAIQVVVDGSASMRPHLNSGAVERVLELLMGVGHVISSSRRVAASVCGQSLTRLAEQRMDAFAAAILPDATALPASIGFRSALIPDGGAGTLTYVVTDAIPADLMAGRADLVHLVLLAAVGQGETGELPVDVSATVIAPQANMGRATSASGVPRDGWDAITNAQLGVTTSSLLSGYRGRFENRP